MFPGPSVARTQSPLPAQLDACFAFACFAGPERFKEQGGGCPEGVVRREKGPGIRIRRERKAPNESGSTRGMGRRSGQVLANMRGEVASGLDFWRDMPWKGRSSLEG